MGRVRSLNYGGSGKVKELRLSVDKDGYLIVALYKGGKNKKCRVHRLVAYAFIPNDNPTEKTDVNHLNEIKDDNRVENLEWVTHKQNMNHGTRNERATKTLSKKVKCVETGEVFESTHEVERKTGLNQSNICQCCRGKNYKTVGGYHWKYVD
jgi:hypothetical protein